MQRLIAHLLKDFQPYTDPAQQIDLDISPVTSVWLRLVLFALGVAGLVGIPIAMIAPILPATPFVLIALVCFARLSRRFQYWLLSMPLFRVMLSTIYNHPGQPFRTLRRVLDALLGHPTIRFYQPQPAPLAVA